MWERKQPRGKKSQAAAWTWLHLKKGGVVNGHLAGPVEWIVVHWHYRSLPCYTDVTDGRLECPHCKSNRRMGELGYVPIYRDDGRPVVVGIPPYNASGIHGIHFGDAVKAYRGKDKGDPIMVTRDKGVASIRVGPDGVRPAADIRPWLLTLWREPDLLRYFGDAPRADDVTVTYTQAVEARRAAEDAERELRVAVGRRIKVTPPDRNAEPGLIGDDLPDYTQPSCNGVHKPR